jgi:hypothetical protein
MDMLGWVRRRRYIPQIIPAAPDKGRVQGLRGRQASSRRARWVLLEQDDHVQHGIISLFSPRVRHLEGTLAVLNSVLRGKNLGTYFGRRSSNAAGILCL